MSITETNRNCEAVIERGLARIGASANEAPSPLQRCGITDAAHTKRLAAKARDQSPLTWSEAVAQAEEIRRMTAAIPRHPPAPVATYQRADGKPVNRYGPRVIVQKAEFQRLFRWVRAVGLRKASEVTGINYFTLRKANQVGRCNIGLAERIAPHVTSL